MIRLGVNVDHVATVRQARLATLPDPVAAALLAEKAGANGITVHLREDRRHIQEYDVRRLMERGKTKVNLEMAVTAAMVRFAGKLRPQNACFVPEKRQELTTEGGLDVIVNLKKRLSSAYKARFSDLTKNSDKHETIVYFLAMLELVKRGAIKVSQEDGGEIEIESESVNLPNYA